MFCYSYRQAVPAQAHSVVAANRRHYMQACKYKKSRCG